MKNRSKKQPLVKKKEFRFHKTEVTNKGKRKSKGWHPVYVFLEKGNIYIYVTLTHSDKVENMLVIKRFSWHQDSFSIFKYPFTFIRIKKADKIKSSIKKIFLGINHLYLYLF